MKICFVIDEFELGSPAQQLLDRFLVGYQRDGEFVESKHSVTVKTEKVGDLLQKRMDAQGLKRGDVWEAEASVVVNAKDLVRAVKWAQPGTKMFVYGRLGENKSERDQILGASNSHGVEVLAGTEIATALRVPEWKAFGRVREALIVVTGKFPEAEMRGLEGLVSMMPQPKAIRSVRHWRGARVWEAGNARHWSWGLLRAALARSDSPQGNAVLDGRTEDLVGRGLLPGMAKDPRAWVIETMERSKIEVLVLDGVVGDVVLAMNVNGAVKSTQIFQSPAPAREDFSRLAAVVDDFFASGKPPWKLERSIWISEVLGEFALLAE